MSGPIYNLTPGWHYAGCRAEAPSAVRALLHCSVCGGCHRANEMCTSPASPLDAPGVYGETPPKPGWVIFDEASDVDWQALLTKRRPGQIVRLLSGAPPGSAGEKAAEVGVDLAKGHTHINGHVWTTSHRGCERCGVRLGKALKLTAWCNPVSARMPIAAPGKPVQRHPLPARATLPPDNGPLLGARYWSAER